MNHTNPKTRHEFVYLFDVTNGNPNGDPDAGNLPRIDPETMHGLVTDVALKRKIRDYVNIVEGREIFIQSEFALNALIKKAADEEKVEDSKHPEADDQKKVQQRLCDEYYDIRMFGAVLATGIVNAGQLRGPVQMTFARSVDPIVALDLSITRVAITREEDMERKETEMGRKTIVPYGLYRTHGYFNPYLAERTGVQEEDLVLFWEALERMFEFDRSAARGQMAPRGLYVFTHENPKGNAPAHRLLDLVSVTRTRGNGAPRSFVDYGVTVGDAPDGVQITTVLDD